MVQERAIYSWVWSLLAYIGFAVFAHPAVAALKVVASIPPVHSLVAKVMDGVAIPELIVRPGASPHAHSLRPSEARALDRADVVFWIGSEMETSLAKPITALAERARVVALSDIQGLIRLNSRHGGLWEEGEPFEESDDDGHDHASAHSGPHTGTVDPHIWLDSHNATRIVATIVDVVTAEDPTNADVYRANGDRAMSWLAALDSDIAERLAPIRDVPYVVFHDAYQYFENRYGVNAVGSITVDPERRPGAKRLAAMRQKITSLDAKCVFSEPQFEPALARTVVEGTPARLAVLDPLGADVLPGPDHYFHLLRGLANSLVNCLANDV